MSKKYYFGGVCTILAIASTAFLLADNPYQTWSSYGSGPDQSKYLIQSQITKDNVKNLALAWSYSTSDQRDYQDNPIIADGIMYVFAKDNSVVALDAATGKEIWIHANIDGIARRGMALWQSADKRQKRLLFTVRNSLQAIDANTGKSILNFGTNGAVDLRQNLGVDPLKVGRVASHTPGTIFGDIIILGSSPGESYLSAPGHIRAYSVRTGALLWRFNTIPQPGEYGYDTWPPEAYKYMGGVNCWGEITVDEQKGIAYIPLGSPTYDYYGADRHGANLFGNCLLALNARTGKRIWHYQTVHHDLWDYDLTAAPQLITVNHAGKKIDAVAIASKQGFLFAFDRSNGKPLWPIEERPVPASDVPGEQAWPTQPFPTVLEPFNRQTVHEDDISSIFLSETEVKNWKERVRNARKGLFTPPGMVETIAMPGAVGGANWGNTAANPSKGLVYVLTQDYPSFYKLEARPPTVSRAFQARIQEMENLQKGAKVYSAHCQICHGKDLDGTGVAPSLLGLGPQLNLNYIHDIVQNGQGRMPPVQHVSDTEIEQIFAFIKDKATAVATRKTIKDVKISGPVVAVGGAPGELATRSNVGFNFAGNPYPEGIQVPSTRYYTGYGLGHAYLLSPPWSSISAYDLNTGRKIWTRPLGEDPHALKRGYQNTGVPTGSQRNGIVVTSNGLLFATVTTGQIYCYDAATGAILWQSQTPLGIASFPSMYQHKGRTYLVVNATTPQIAGWNQTDEQKEQNAKEAPKGGAYYVYALPK
jgi:quinoprotein glucose dehydrogenase